LPLASCWAWAARLRASLARARRCASSARLAVADQDRHATYAAVTLDAVSDEAKLDAYDEIRSELDAPGLITEVGGVVPLQAAADEQVERDLARGEMIAMPIVLVLLVLILGGVVAAGMPLLIGGLAVLGRADDDPDAH